jgi:carbon-monoxide dehydrogenase medium subunit
VFARPGLPDFEYIRATSKEHVVALLQEHGDDARLLMGGTDLFAALRDGRSRPRVVIDVKALAGIQDVVYDEREGLVAGAAVTMNLLAHHPDVVANYPLLSEAADTVASYQIRNRATLGGNLCNASPCADTSPAVLALNGECGLYGPEGERWVPSREFFVGPGRTVLQCDEFLTAIRFPAPIPVSASRYLKLGRCRAGDLALVGVAVFAHPGETESGYQFRVALGSVAPVPKRAAQAEDYLAVHPPGEETFATAAERATREASPITDVRGSAAYQKAMVGTLTVRGLRDVWAQLQGERGLEV